MSSDDTPNKDGERSHVEEAGESSYKGEPGVPGIVVKPGETVSAGQVHVGDLRVYQGDPGGDSPEEAKSIYAKGVSDVVGDPRAYQGDPATPADDDLDKPAIGLIPCRLWKEQSLRARAQDITRAVMRCMNQAQTIPEEWFDELRAHAKVLSALRRERDLELAKLAKEDAGNQGDK